MIGGQSHDLELEGRPEVALDEVLEMEANKTAALLSCAASIGALALCGFTVRIPASTTTGAPS